MSFRAGSDESSIAHINIDSKCKNPVAIAYSDIDSIFCGTSCGPVTCPNSPASTSVDIDSYDLTTIPEQQVTSPAVDEGMQATSSETPNGAEQT